MRRRPAVAGIGLRAAGRATAHRPSGGTGTVLFCLPARQHDQPMSSAAVKRMGIDRWRPWSGGVQQRRETASEKKTDYATSSIRCGADWLADSRSRPLAPEQAPRPRPDRSGPRIGPAACNARSRDCHCTAWKGLRRERPGRPEAAIGDRHFDFPRFNPRLKAALHLAPQAFDSGPSPPVMVMALG